MRDVAKVVQLRTETARRRNKYVIEVRRGCLRWNQTCCIMSQKLLVIDKNETLFYADQLHHFINILRLIKFCPWEMRIVPKIWVERMRGRDLLVYKAFYCWESWMKRDLLANGNTFIWARWSAFGIQFRLSWPAELLSPSQKRFSSSLCCYRLQRKASKSRTRVCEK